MLAMKPKHLIVRVCNNGGLDTITTRTHKRFLCFRWAKRLNSWVSSNFFVHFTTRRPTVGHWAKIRSIRENLVELLDYEINETLSYKDKHYFVYSAFYDTMKKLRNPVYVWVTEKRNG